MWLCSQQARTDQYLLFLQTARHYHMCPFVVILSVCINTSAKHSLHRLPKQHLLRQITSRINLRKQATLSKYCAPFLSSAFVSGVNVSRYTSLGIPLPCSHLELTLDRLSLIECLMYSSPVDRCAPPYVDRVIVQTPSWCAFLV